MTPTYRLDPPARPRLAIAVAIGFPVVVIVVALFKYLSEVSR